MFPTRLFNSIFLVVGVILLGVAIYTYQSTSQFVRAAAKTNGQVVAMEAHRSRTKSGMSTSYNPVVRFRAATNEEIQFTSNFSTSPPMHHVGEKVTVLYRRDTPHDAQISDFWSLWFAPILLTGMGTIFTGVGTALMFSRPATFPQGFEDRYRNAYREQQQTPYTRL